MNHNFDVDGLDREVTVLHMKGVEGPSLYVNDRRVAGPKPWGGGTIVREWKTTLRDILEAVLDDDRPELWEALSNLLDACDALATSTEEPRA